MACNDRVPGNEAATVSVATPSAPTAAVPNGVPSLLKLTVPVSAAPGTDGATVAIKVKVPPRTTVAGAVRDVDVWPWLLGICGGGGDTGRSRTSTAMAEEVLAPKLKSPE